MEMTNEQQVIKTWFDTTYKTQGFNYLRPVRAYDIFGQILQTKTDDKHLDVACGLGLMLKSLETRTTDLHGIDISEEAIKQCQEFVKHAHVGVGNAEDLPYPDHTFDSITCLGSLERMIDRDQVLSEMVRVSKPGANLCLMVRNAENFTWRYFQKPFNLYNKRGHQDALNLKQWKELFENSGLKTVQIYPDHWPYYRLLDVLVPWRKTNTSRLYKFPFSISLAYEFIFHLKKV